MNVENILTLANYLENYVTDEHFDMHSYVSDQEFQNHQTPVTVDYLQTCGTTACIAGWAVAVFEYRSSLTTFNFYDAGIDVLGFELFVAYEPDATRLRAVQVLRDLAETGEVKWEITP